jgi:hypothetical protein
MGDLARSRGRPRRWQRSSREEEAADEDLEISGPVAFAFGSRLADLMQQFQKADG